MSLHNDLCQNILLKLDNLVEGNIISRPSKLVKSPYVADVNIKGKTVLAHTASLGCCGLSDVNSSVLMEPKMNIKYDNDEYDKKCKYSVYLSILREKNAEVIVGIHPKMAERLVETALTKNLLTKLYKVKSYKRETKIYVRNKVDSRFDFTGIDCNGIPFIMEVKNVPLADYENIPSKERKNKNYKNRDINSKIAYFPDGYRKKITDTVSPRALKHIKELTLIKSESKTRCIMCYVIQRNDVKQFQLSVVDPEYKEAVKMAINAGVEIITMVVEWTREGEAKFICDDLYICV